MHGFQTINDVPRVSNYTVVTVQPFPPVKPYPEYNLAVKILYPGYTTFVAKSYLRRNLVEGMAWLLIVTDKQENWTLLLQQDFRPHPPKKHIPLETRTVCYGYEQ